MMGRGVVLGVVVGEILLAGLPVHSELSLFYPILDPVESHVHRLGSFGLDRVVGDAFCGGVVGLDWGGAVLRMAHFLYRVAKCASFLSVSEQASSMVCTRCAKVMSSITETG